MVDKILWAKMSLDKETRPLNVPGQNDRNNMAGTANLAPPPSSVARFIRISPRTMNRVVVNTTANINILKHEQFIFLIGKKLHFIHL